MNRADWEGFADRLLAATEPFASPAGAAIHLPGAVGGYGHAVDGLEGYARTLLAAGFRVAGADGADPRGLLDRYAAGLIAGVDRDHPEAWVRLDEHGQAMVEAASVVLVLHLTRPWLWDALPERTRAQVIDWLTPAVGADYPANNWLWFQVLTQTFLASVGGPHSRERIAANLERIEGWYRGGGWYTDGGHRQFDHYSGWAMQFYPLVWARMAAGTGVLPDGELAGLRATFARRALAYGRDAVALVGGDGAPLLQGRSLSYRFATLAPLWAAAFAWDEDVTPPDGAPSRGLLRATADATLAHFGARGVPNAAGLLDTGWYGYWPALAQDYSGPGSPYWAAKGLAGLLLGADHPFWTGAPEPLPGDDARVLPAPGWLVTRRRGLVRVTNHGTDPSEPGSTLPESPLYGRFTYSGATSPRLDPWLAPVEDAVTVLDAAGTPSARAGTRDNSVAALDSGTLRGHSAWRAHWSVRDAGEADHGRARTGSGPEGPELAVTSYVRGDWEVRLVRVRPGGPVAGGVLRVGGTGVPAGAEPVLLESDGAVEVGGAPAPGAVPLRARVVDLGGLPVTGRQRWLDATPLSAVTLVGWVESDGPALAREWYAAALGLGRFPDGPADLGAAPSLTWAGGAPSAITWPDGVVERL